MTQAKAENLRKKSNKESMTDVIKIWKKVGKIKEAMKVGPESYPYGLSQDFYNKHQNYLKLLLQEEMDKLSFIEKMIDAQNTKYKPLDFING